MKKCVSCKKGTLCKVDDIVNELDGYLVIVKGERCIACGEEVIGELELQRMVNLAKRLGVWGNSLKLHRKLSRSARGTVLRIPVDIEKDMHLKGNEEVTISKFGKNRIIIEIGS